LIPLAGSLEPVALTGSMSIKRCNGPRDDQCEMFTARVFTRRLSVLNQAGELLRARAAALRT
jgi:hypothetical protein